MQEIIDELLKNQDMEYKKFQEKLIPSVEADKIIGVRTPSLRLIAKRIFNENKYIEFFSELPHKYFEENQIHGFLFSWIKDYDFLITELVKFFPYIDNWATCDIIAPRSFKRNTDKLLPHIYEWLGSNGTYTVRFGIGMLLKYYLDAPLFNPKYLEAVAEVKSDEYYVNMMKAWYIATALAKQYDAVLPILQEKLMDSWSHNKAIQKARESYRITPQQKEYLSTLKV